MPRRTRRLKLEVTDHAWKRYCERVAPIAKEDLAGLVGTYLRHQLRLGVRACGESFIVRLPNRRHNGCLVVGIKAYVVPEASGRWVCTTVRSVRVTRVRRRRQYRWTLPTGGNREGVKTVGRP
jgi:hypothetical protein